MSTCMYHYLHQRGDVFTCGALCVGWFVSRITLKVLNRFPQNMDGGWVSAHNKDFLFPLWDRELIDFPESNAWIMTMIFYLSRSCHELSPKLCHLSAFFYLQAAENNPPFMLDISVHQRFTQTSFCHSFSVSALWTQDMVRICGIQQGHSLCQLNTVRSCSHKTKPCTVDVTVLWMIAIST